MFDFNPTSTPGRRRMQNSYNVGARHHPGTPMSGTKKRKILVASSKEF
jgi:hypothetical protein